MYTRPSIQLGALKAFLSYRFSGLRTECHHFYLQLAAAIGYPVYHEISKRTWLAESIYATLLFPDRFQRIAELFRRQIGSTSPARKTGLEKISRQVQKTTSLFIDRVNWQTYGLAGFSVSQCQLTSALYVIKTIKKMYPALPIVVGGSTFSTNSARSLLKLFPQIDAVVIGEGELALGKFIQHLRTSGNLTDLPEIRGVLTSSRAPGENTPIRCFQMDTLKKLPVPDYDDFFKLLQSFPDQKLFFPTLPVEISRGCWWKQPASSDKTTGCAFCNLNLQWSGYRFKDSLQAVSEIDQLTTKYKTLSIAITDNILPQNTAAKIFGRLGRLKKDLRLFSEIRASMSMSELKIMRDAGVQEVQIGIEALSTGLLKKLKKGTTTIQNIEIMRNCEALGIENISNLILQFPGSDEQDVAETLRSLEFVLSYRPLKVVNFWLGLESPVWQNPHAYRIEKVFNHPNWSYLFPGSIHRHLQFMIQDYRGDKTLQRSLWRPVRKKVKEWQNIYNQLNQRRSKAPALRFRDGRDFLIIRQEMLAGDTLTHRLKGTSRAIYLFCQQPRSIRHIRTRFAHFAEDKLVAFLRMMVEKRLMFTEKNRYLSLAAPKRP